MIDLSDQTALVTGSGTGIGRGVALKLAELGATVAVNGRREGPCRETEQLIEAEGGHAVVVTGDVSVAADAARILDVVVKATGRCDVLVNNAGVQRVAWFDRILRDIPLGRAADTRNEVGAAIAFLASPSASYVTGAKFSAGGGVGMCISS